MSILKFLFKRALLLLSLGVLVTTGVAQARSQLGSFRNLVGGALCLSNLSYTVLKWDQATHVQVALLVSGATFLLSKCCQKPDQNRSKALLPGGRIGEIGFVAIGVGGLVYAGAIYLSSKFIELQGFA